MAKALLGHVGTDARMAADLRRLALRVRELERDLAQAREVNRALVAQLLELPSSELVDVINAELTDHSNDTTLAESAAALA